MFFDDDDDTEDLEDVQYDYINDLHVWWLPQDFTQTGYGEFSEYGNSSCTLISLSFAERLSNLKDFSKFESQLPNIAWVLMGDSIDDGNHAYMDNDVDDMIFTVPQGIFALQSHSRIDFHLEEWFFTHLCTEDQSNLYIVSALSKIFHTTIGRYQQSEFWETYPKLFAAITADNRCVMVSIDLITSIVTLFDSHRHGKNGAVFAQTTLYYMDSMMDWYINMIETMFFSHPPIIEISFITPMPDVWIHIPPAFDAEANKLS